jgi:hypothetical protein
MEELEVLAKVEDEELFLVLTRPKQIWAEAGSSSDHLPKLGLGADNLEENKVYDLRHVDASVQHIDGDSDVGGFLDL